jgi:hypothetical protein
MPVRYIWVNTHNTGYFSFIRHYHQIIPAIFEFALVGYWIWLTLEGNASLGGTNDELFVTTDSLEAYVVSR